MNQKQPEHFWNAWRVLLYAIIVGLVLFVIYKQSLVLRVLQQVLHIGITVVLGLAVAYLLNPFANRLCRFPFPADYRTRRTLASLLLVIVFMAVVIGLVIITAVPVYQGIQDLYALLQEQSQTLPQRLTEWLQKYEEVVPPGLADLIESKASEWASLLLQANVTAAKWVVLRGWLVVELLLIPVLAFHFMRDGQALRESLLTYIPRRHQQTSRLMLDDVHRVLKSYVRGILTLCLFFGTTTALLLYFAGTKMYLTLGLLAGMSWAIPIVGPIIAGIGVVGITLLQSGLKTAAIVCAIYILLNILDSKVVTPFILGEAVRLHPITVIIALLLAGQLLGIVGMLVAVPAAAAIRITYLRWQKLKASEETSA